MKIYLIRHGISIANEQIRYAGTWDVPLSENGVRDVEMKRDAGLYPKKDGIRLCNRCIFRKNILKRVPNLGI